MIQALQRVRVFNQGRVNAPASEAWRWLTDWAGTRRLRSHPGGELEFAKIELIGAEDEIPRTRVIEFPTLGVVRETLLYQSDAAMHLYYRIDGEGPLGILNYLATTDIDPLSDSGCLVTITARFDLAPDADILRAKGLIDAAHNQAVIAGMRRYFAAGTRRS